MLTLGGCCLLLASLDPLYTLLESLHQTLSCCPEYAISFLWGLTMLVPKAYFRLL